MTAITILSGAAAPPAGAYDADVIILSFDRTADTIAAINSALMQTGVSLHVTVLDQGSHPDNLHLLTRTFATHQQVSIFSTGQNHGVAGGRNIATNFGHGQVIVALDNDAEFSTPDLVLHSLMHFGQDEALAAIGFRIVVAATRQDDLSSWGYPAALLPRASEAFATTTFVGAGHAIRRRAWDDAGGYDPTLFFCWEEFDFCLRAISLGWRIAYHGDLEILHKVTAEHRFSWSGTRWFYFVRNRLYIGWKIREPFLDLGLRAAAYLVKGIRNGLLMPTLRAISAARRMRHRTSRITLDTSTYAYLRQNDAAHRGSLWRRLNREVLARLPGLH